MGDNMVDIHTHILPNIDDGSVSIEDTMEILKNAKEAGFKALVSTSHYIEGSYEADNEKKKELLNNIKMEAKNREIDIDLYIGNEVFITENIISLIEKNKIISINNSRYLLVELPRTGGLNGLQNCVFKLFSAGFTPIIAHPERYSFVQRDPNILLEFLDQGVLFQMNSGSLLGHYGKTAQKTARILLEHKMVQFIATDTHRSTNISYECIGDIKKQICKSLGKEYINILLNENPIKILKNEKLVCEEATKYKKGLFDFLK